MRSLVVRVWAVAMNGRAGRYERFDASGSDRARMESPGGAGQGRGGCGALRPVDPPSTALRDPGQSWWPRRPLRSVCAPDGCSRASGIARTARKATPVVGFNRRGGRQATRASACVGVSRRWAGVGIGPSTGTSRHAKRCSRPSTSTRSRRSRARPPTSQSRRPGGAFTVAAPVRRLRGDQTRADAGAARGRAGFGRSALLPHRDPVRGDRTAGARAEAGVVRPDANFTDVGRMVSGIAVVPTSDPEQQERMLQLALDGLRYRPQDA
jgi:transcriptional regulator SbtR-like protein